MSRFPLRIMMIRKYYKLNSLKNLKFYSLQYTMTRMKTLNTDSENIQDISDERYLPTI